MWWRKPVVAMAVAAVGALMLVPRAQAQQGDQIRALQGQIESLTESQAEMKTEVAQILKILEPLKRRQEAMQFKPQDLSVADAPFVGKDNAPVTVVEFLDYQCPFCRRYHESVEPQLMKDYVSTGKVKLVVRQFPLAAIHPAATDLAQAMLCAGDQGKYWDLAAVVFDHPKHLARADLSGYAKSLKLDSADFDKCLSSGRYKQRVQADESAGQKLGVSGTPSFVIGLSDAKDPSRIRASSLIRGAQPYAEFKQTIDGLLAKEKRGA